MKFLDRLINFIFSLVMIIVSVTVLLVIFDFSSVEFVNGLFDDYVWNTEYETIVIVVSTLVFLAGLKTTIFLADFKKKKKIPIMVNTGNGNVQIASETIESTAKAVARSYEEVKDVNAKMVNKPKGVVIYMSLLVAQDTNIRELTKKIQEEVKTKVNDTTGVIVLNTDIKVKNIIEKNKKVVKDIQEPLVVTGNYEKVIENKVVSEEKEEVYENSEKEVAEEKEKIETEE